jgi:hypothetical protein
MMEYFEVITNAVTGEQTIRPYTPEEIAALTAPPPKAAQEEARRAAYVVEADPLFFMAQRGESTMEEWQAKIAEIKARFPYPAE